MNILSVVHYPTFGGPHNRNMRLAPLLADRGMSLTVLLPEEEGNAVGRLRDAGVSVVQMPLHRLRLSRSLRLQAEIVMGLPRDVWQLRKFITQNAIDVVLINGLVNPQAGLSASLEGVPVVWQILDTFPPPLLRRAAMTVVKRAADSVMCTGEVVADQHPGARSFGERLFFFFPPVDTDVVRPDPQVRISARRELGLPDDGLVIGNVGNLNPMKGHSTFIQAAAAVRRASDSRCRFVILGGSYAYRGGYEQRLRNQAEELGLNVGSDLIIKDPGSRSTSLAAAFDIFWLSAESRSEGVPTAVGEAMALGLPVVATDVGSVAEAVRDGESGFLVPPGDAATLAARTMPLLGDAGLRAQLGARGRTIAERSFSLNRCADCHEEAILAAVKARGARRSRLGLQGPRDTTNMSALSAVNGLKKD